MIEIMNLSGVDQHHGKTTIPPQKWTPIPDSLAIRLADDPDYRCDTPLEDYLFHSNDTIHLGWSSPIWYCDGYGSIGQDIADEFLRMESVKLSIALRDYHPGQTRCGGLPLDRWHEDGFVPQSIVDRLGDNQEKALYGINLTYPKDCHRSAFPRTIAYTMFETTATPIEWTEPMNLCRRILTPCETSKQAFQARGVRVPIHVVPQGVNPDAWPVVDRKHRDQPFTFLIAGGLTYRKNPIGAVRAFLAAFSDVKDVRLIVKTRGGTLGGFQNWLNQIPNDDRIQIIAENSTPQQMFDVFASADAFVWPSRGEGFGLPPVAAMSTGLPVIVSENSGMMQYCDDRYNYPIECKEVPVPKQADGGYPEEWGDCGNWWEPDFDALVESMQEVYKHRVTAYRRGQKAARWVRENWTIGHTCQKILEIVCDDARESGLECE